MNDKPQAGDTFACQTCSLTVQCTVACDCTDECAPLMHCGKPMVQQ